eukprot:2808327-Pleurochrysis_carterae.AAC.1
MKHAHERPDTVPRPLTPLPFYSTRGLTRCRDPLTPLPFCSTRGLTRCRDPLTLLPFYSPLSSSVPGSRLIQTRGRRQWHRRATTLKQDDSSCKQRPLISQLRACSSNRERHAGARAHARTQGERTPRHAARPSTPRSCTRARAYGAESR